MEALLEAIRDGRHVAVVGEVPDLPGVAVLRVNGADPAPFAPVLAAAEQVEAYGASLGGAPARRGLRRRMLGELPEPVRGEALVDALNSLADNVGQPLCLVFEHTDHADPATIRLLQQVLARPGWCRVPLVLSYDDDPQGELADAVDDEEIELPASFTLRAAAAFGSRFDAASVAAVTEQPLMQVLADLQEAADHGLPLRDLGDGHFLLAEELVDALRRTTLPSLRSELTCRVAGRCVDVAKPPSEAPAVDAEFEDAPDVDDAPVADAPAAANDDIPDEVRADLARASQSARLGAPAAAITYARRALDTLASLEQGDATRLLRIRVLLETGVMLYDAVGPSRDLSHARDTLAEALDLLSEDDALALQVEVREVLASVCYDLGDTASLSTALELLGQATRLLLDASEPITASTLLNDQAAVYMRLGDPVRAAHLLEQSRQVFAEHAEDSDIAREELAETDHLLARLPLHVASKPGLEQEALSKAAEHAASAAAAYVELGNTWALARVRETQARLATMLGEHEQADAWLAQAADEQRQNEDVIGLARTTGAMADALIAQGEHGRALALLDQSIALNTSKGTPLGVAYNRRAIEQLLESLSPQDGMLLAGPLEALMRDLSYAEELVGRHPLPGDA